MIPEQALECLNNGSLFEVWSESSDFIPSYTSERSFVIQSLYGGFRGFGDPLPADNFYEAPYSAGAMVFPTCFGINIATSDYCKLCIKSKVKGLKIMESGGVHHSIVNELVPGNEETLRALLHGNLGLYEQIPILAPIVECAIL